MDEKGWIGQAPSCYSGPMQQYTFCCTLCGECCSGSMKVFVNSHDLYKMGRFLKFSHSEELFKKGYVKMEEGQNGLTLPRLRFKKKPFPFCPFLMNDLGEDGVLRGRCSLHLKHKPLVCRLAPLHRELNLDTGEEAFDFILPHPGCPGKAGEGIICVEEERRVLGPELDFERRYYALLSRKADNPAFLWHFPLTGNFEETLKSWEENS